MGACPSIERLVMKILVIIPDNLVAVMFTSAFSEEIAQEVIDIIEGDRGSFDTGMTAQVVEEPA